MLSTEYRLAKTFKYLYCFFNHCLDCHMQGIIGRIAVFDPKK